MKRGDVLAAFLGGGLGAAWREVLMLGVADLPSGFPAAIFLANMIAAAIIGLAAGWAAQGTMSGRSRLFLMTGICGGLSTFSTFMWDAEQMLRTTDQRVTAVVYLIGSMVLGLILVWLASRTGARIAARGRDAAT